MNRRKVKRVTCGMCHGTSLRTNHEIADRVGCSHCGYRRPRKYIRWTHTRKALAEYDRIQPERVKALDNSNTTEKALAALAAIEKDEEAVQHAFWQDTNDRNSRDNCALVGVETIRRMVAGLPTRS